MEKYVGTVYPTYSVDINDYRCYLTTSSLLKAVLALVGLQCRLLILDSLPRSTYLTRFILFIARSLSLSFIQHLLMHLPFVRHMWLVLTKGKDNSFSSQGAHSNGRKPMSIGL